jgi:dedicator of cytokinesis protein 9/10/11
MAALKMIVEVLEMCENGCVKDVCLPSTATHSFPYVKKRIEVKEGGRKEVVLTPIEVAIDEMQVKMADLREAINSPVPDMKRLQLKLQGGVSAQVSI